MSNYTSKVLSKCVLSLETLINRLDIRFNGLIAIEAYRGFYILYKNKPLFLYSDELYAISKEGVFYRLYPKDFNDVLEVGMIYNKYMELVYDLTPFKKLKKGMIKNLPESHVVWIDIVFNVIKNYIESKFPEASLRKSPTSLSVALNPNHPLASEFDTSVIIELAEDFFDEIDNFIDGDVWNLYFVKTQKAGLSIVIEKGEDYRIVDWMNTFKRKANEDDGE